MNQKLALLAIVEILSSISIGVFILFITYRFMKVVGKKSFGIEKVNLAYSIFMASVLLAVGYIVSGVIGPLLSAYRLLIDLKETNLEIVLTFLSYGGIFVSVAYLIAIFVMTIGILFYVTLTTKVQEFKELRENNVSVAVIVGTIIFVLALFVKDGSILLIESIIPYPELPPK